MAPSKEPPPKRMQLRSRALAYVRQFGRRRRLSTPQSASRRSSANKREPIRPVNQSFPGSGEARSPIRVVDRRSFVDSNGARPTRLASKRSISASNCPRPLLRVASRSKFAASSRTSSGRKRVVQEYSTNTGTGSTREIKVNKRNRRSNQARKSSRHGRKDCIKSRKRFLAPLHGQGGHRFWSFCECVKKAIFDRGETSSFHWGVGFDDNNYYSSSKKRRLSSGTRFRLGLCGFHVNSCRKSSASGLSVDWSSVGSHSASFDSGFAVTCESPVACPPPLGLAPARPLSTTLQLHPRNRTNTNIFTFSSESSAIVHSSTGLKRKTSSSSSYSSYTPKTPPSPFMNDFRSIDTLKSTRARSRVSVGCNGWLLADDDPTIVGWYRRRSSGEVKLKSASTAHFSHVIEASRDSEAGIISPKRLKTLSHIHETSTRISTSRLPLSSISSRPSSTPRSRPSNSTKSPDSQVSILLLPRDGSVPSTYDRDDWGTRSALPLECSRTSRTPAMLYRPSFPSTPPDQFKSPRLVDATALLCQGNAEMEIMEYDPPSKRRRSTSSSSNSSGGFGLGNLQRTSMVDSERLNTENNSSPKESTSLTARVMRLTKSHSPRTFKRTFFSLPQRPRKRAQRSRSQSLDAGGRRRHKFHLRSKANAAKSTPPSQTSSAIAPRLSIIFIDCSP